MTTATEYEAGPLAWVKSEIDQALERADQALHQYTESVLTGPGDLARIRDCRAHLHQARGALTMVGLDGARLVAESLENLLEAIEKMLRPAGESSIALGHRTLWSIGRYLDDLIAGQPNHSLRLRPIYEEIQKARGVDTVSPADLFFPDLSIRPPAADEPPSLTPEDQQRRLRQARGHFQKGLLAWLRAPNDPRGANDMLGAVHQINTMQDPSSAHAFWWIATGLMAALREGSLPANCDAKPLCARIDLQIRRRLEGSMSVAERLMRDALYLIAHCESSHPAAIEIQQAYQLVPLLAAEPIVAPAPDQNALVLRRLRDATASAEETWNKFCAGTALALPTFQTQIAAVATLVEQLGHTDYRRLAQAIAAAANWLAEDSARHSEDLATEIATGILLSTLAHENFRQLGSDFAQQVDVTVARIHRCIAGGTLPTDSEDPALDALSHQARETLLNRHFAKEIQTHLAQIELQLDAFFRDPEKRDELATLQTPLDQIEAALAQLDQPGAVAALHTCAREIDRFISPTYVPLEADFESVANALSLMGFFIDALAHGEIDFDSFARQMKNAGAAEDQGNALDHEAGPDLNTLGEAAIEESTASEGASHAPAQAESTPDAVSAPPAFETPTFGLASNEEIDAELLGIFLEEAREVLDTIEESHAQLSSQPHDIELLTTLRRAFHTLKGSGRMVGLKEVGEAAWAVEQTLNFWLRQEQEINAALLALIEQAKALFRGWVEHLDSGKTPAPATDPLIAFADSLRKSGVENSVQIPAPATPGEAPASAEIIAIDFPTPAKTPVSKPEDSPPTAHTEAKILSFGTGQPGTTGAAEETGAPRTILSGALLEIFQEEAAGHLASLRRELPLLEAEEIASTPPEMIRAAHTLAGISATVGFRQLNQIGHALEYALLRRDQSAHPGSLEALGVIRRSIDEIDLILSALADQREILLPTGLIESLKALYPAQPPDPTESADAPLQTASAPDDVAAAGAKDRSPPASDAPKLSTLVAALTQHQDEIDAQLLPIFIEEAQDLTQAIATQLRAWHNDPDDQTAVAALARLLHTLKGSARMAGAMNLGEITHAIETRVADTSRTGAASIETIEDISNVFDDVQQIIDRLQHGESFEADACEGDACERQASNTDTETDAADTACDPSEPATVITTGDPDPAQPPTQPPSGAGAPLKRANLRVRADLVDRLANEAGELSIARTRIEGEMRELKSSLLDLTENVIRLRRQLRDIEIQAETQMQSGHAAAPPANADFDPLEFDRFTQFQELTRMMAESVNDVATVQQNLLKNLDDANAAIAAQARLNRSLQNELMAVRMVPFGTLSDRLYRIVRQTSKALEKRVNLEIIGGRVELDRSVLDKMNAPLEHLLRNAIAHGLESSEARRRAGKPETGEITLSLVQEGNEVILSLADDGAGLDLPRIRERAIAAGLLEEDTAVSDERLAEMIFMPGFSTAAELSQIAGRGIGMDVVKNEVAHLGGRIEITSLAGQGTTFRLFIPLTLALTKALLVRVGHRRFAIPGALVEQVLDLKEAALAEIRSAGLVDWQGQTYPFSFLPHLFGEPAALPERQRQYWVLLLRSGARRMAVQVDELMGNREVVIKNIGPQLARVVGIDGATVLGGGEVVLIVNPIALLARAPGSGTPAVVTASTTAAHLPTVMVVDDSLTVRKVTSRMLAREGYQVLVAKDGVEALEQLTDIVPDLMLVDIEMPRLDGFDLTRTVRADERLHDTPIIMITSRTGEKHRRTAFEAGVNHFLGKPFQEEELLRLVTATLSAPPSV